MRNTEICEVSEISPTAYVRVFRRTVTDLAEFAGMEVDAYVALGERYVVLLDTLICPDDMGQILETLTPFLLETQLLCVNSHADWDHAWGNGWFTEGGFPAPIIGHERCSQRLLSPQTQQELADFRARSQTFTDVELVPPSLTFSETLTIADPAWTIRLLHAPGHCDEHIVAWLPEARLLLAFDAVEYPWPSISGATGVPLMFQTLQRLVALNASHVLCSHSGSASPALIQTNLDYFREIERRARLWLATRRSDETEIDNAAALIGYPASEALVGVREGVDQDYYGQVHEQNVQAIVDWLLARL
jgi:glyoxylase-like metal-dependent hydrolase (beta-lactamase superfamily II)